MEKLLKQKKLINRTGCYAVCLFAMRIGKIIFYIVCSMFDARIISGHVYMQLRVWRQMRWIVDIIQLKWRQMRWIVDIIYIKWSDVIGQIHLSMWQ